MGCDFLHLYLRVSYDLLTKCGDSVHAFSYLTPERTDREPNEIIMSQLSKIVVVGSINCLSRIGIDC